MKKNEVINYLKGPSPEERKRFYKEAEKALREPTPEEVKMTQGQRLFDLGFGELFKMSKDEFLSEIPLPKEGRGRILVVSAKYVSPEISMTLIEVNGENGDNYLYPSSLKDIVATPRGRFYWRYDLLYQPYSGKSPLACKRLIKKERRLPGTANEAVYVCAQHPEILREQWLDCPGSRYSRGHLPCLNLYDGRPKLDAYAATSNNSPNDGSFSFGSGT